MSAGPVDTRKEEHAMSKIVRTVRNVVVASKRSAADPLSDKRLKDNIVPVKR